jgi:hypothetical protein
MKTFILNRNIILLAAAVALFTLGCSRMFHGGWFGFGVRGSGVEKTEQRDIGAFTAIDVGGAYELEVVCGQSPRLEITGDDNILPLIKTEVRGGTLVIESRENINPKLTLRLKIGTQDLERLESSGASDVKIAQVNNNALRIETSGAGSVVADVRTKTLTVETSGAGDVRASGQTDTFSIETSGAGKVRAKDLQAQRVTVRISGAGDAEVTALQELNARVSGAGDVTYYGNPSVVNQEVSGAGSVNKRN